jgi:hypothetical protein
VTKPDAENGPKFLWEEPGQSTRIGADVRTGSIVCSDVLETIDHESDAPSWPRKRGNSTT